VIGLLGKFTFPALLVLAGLFLLREHDKAVRATALAAERLKHLEARDVAISKLEVRLAVRDSEVAVQRKTIETANAKTAQQIQATQVSLAATVKEFEATLDSAQKVRFATIEAEHKHIVDLKDQQIAGLNRIIAMNDSLNAERKQVQEGLSKLRTDLLKQTRDLTDKVTPSTLDKIGKAAIGVTLILSSIGAFK